MPQTFSISVKFSKLDFDDYIEFENRKVQLTHYDIDCKTPLFSQFTDGQASKPIYCVGFKNAIDWLKTGVIENPKIKTKTSKAILDDKQLIVLTQKDANDSTNFFINYDGQYLECWEFNKILFPELSDLDRSNLMLFSPWFTNVFAPAKYKKGDFGEDLDEAWKEARKYSFPSTFNVLHWNVAKHIVERIAIVRKVLNDQSA